MKAVGKTLVVGAWVLSVAACRAMGPSAPEETQWSGGSAAGRSTTPPGSATALLVPSILPTPSTIVDLDQGLLATFRMDYPDELTFVEGAIWVRSDRGRLFRIDPATNTVTGDIRVDATSDPSHYCHGLGTDGHSIWTCSARDDGGARTIDVVRVDPATMSVVETFEVDKMFDQFDMPYVGNQIWVLSGIGDRLIGIDVTTRRAHDALDLSARCFQLAAVADSLIATCRLDNLILRIDPGTRTVMDWATVSDARMVTATADGVWVLEANAMVRLDSRTLRPIARFPELRGVGVSGTDGAVWVRAVDGFVYRIDARSNEITTQIRPDRPYSGGDILHTPAGIWTTATDDGLLMHLRVE